MPNLVSVPSAAVHSGYETKSVAALIQPYTASTAVTCCFITPDSKDLPS